MSLSEMLLPEFDREMSTTRKFLERIPDDRLNWKPHEKSWTLAQLGTHLSNIPSWIGYTIKLDSLDVNPPGEEPYREPEKQSRQEMLDDFDKKVAEGRSALVSASDDALHADWTLLAAGNAILTMPRIDMLRSYIMNHSIHHRAQLGVYLRLCDVPVPAAYGPTADDSGF
jgi:uncharacterized damage-inducible protein DinB